MARSNRCWIWQSGEVDIKSTLYVQVDDGSDDIDQVVFRWNNHEQAIARLRSTGEELIDCHLISINEKGCSVDIGGMKIDFDWIPPTIDRAGLIAEGIPQVKQATTWAEKRRQRGGWK